MMDDNDVVVLNNGSKIALKKFYNLEKNIIEWINKTQIGLIEVVENDSYGIGLMMIIFQNHLILVIGKQLLRK